MVLLADGSNAVHNSRLRFSLELMGDIDALLLDYIGVGNDAIYDAIPFWPLLGPECSNVCLSYNESLLVFPIVAATSG